MKDFCHRQTLYNIVDAENSCHSVSLRTIIGHEDLTIFLHPFIKTRKSCLETNTKVALRYHPTTI